MALKRTNTLISNELLTTYDRIMSFSADKLSRVGHIMVHTYSLGDQDLGDITKVKVSYIVLFNQTDLGHTDLSDIIPIHDSTNFDTMFDAATLSSLYTYLKTLDAFSSAEDVFEEGQS